MMTPLDPQHDVIASYAHEIVHWDWRQVAALKRKPNGDCWYLGEHGCTIYKRRPYVCRQFDCRVHWRDTSEAAREHAIRRGIMDRAIFERGKELVEAS